LATRFAWRRHTWLQAEKQAALPRKIDGLFSSRHYKQPIQLREIRSHCESLYNSARRIIVPRPRLDKMLQPLIHHGAGIGGGPEESNSGTNVDVLECQFDVPTAPVRCSCIVLPTVKERRNPSLTMLRRSNALACR
jgi:hypothetical protein